MSPTMNLSPAAQEQHGPESHQTAQSLADGRARKSVCWIVTKEMTVITFLVPILRALSARFDVSLIVDTPAADRLQSELGAGVELIPIRMERAPAPGADLFALMRIAQILKRKNFDVVHTLTPKAGLLGMLAARVCRVPIRIHTFQGEVWASRTGFWRWLLKVLDKRVAHWATNVLVVSESGRQFLAEQNIVPIEKAQVIGAGSICGVDMDRFKPDSALRERVREAHGTTPSDIVFLFVGRLNRDKGIPELIAAFDALLLKVPDARLWLVGPDEENINEQLAPLKPASRAQIWLSDFRRDPEAVMAAADVLVLPSHREGFGMTVIEAAACGIPAIVSNVHGLSDACVANTTALTHNKGHPESLLACMLEFAENAALRQRFGEAARQRVLSKFTQQRVVSGLLDYYVKLCEPQTSATFSEDIR